MCLVDRKRERERAYTLAHTQCLYVIWNGNVFGTSIRIIISTENKHQNKWRWNNWRVKQRWNSIHFISLSKKKNTPHAFGKAYMHKYIHTEAVCVSRHWVFLFGSFCFLFCLHLHTIQCHCCAIRLSHYITESSSHFSFIVHIYMVHISTLFFRFSWAFSVFPFLQEYAL